MQKLPPPLPYYCYPTPQLFDTRWYVYPANLKKVASIIEEKFTRRHLYHSFFFFCNFIKKESLVQVFSCEFCKISKNIFFTEHLRETASVIWKSISILFIAAIHLIFPHQFDECRVISRSQKWLCILVSQ